MHLQLPVLTRDVDCEALGYPGVIVTYRLNLPYEEHEFPWESVPDEEARKTKRGELLEAEPWLSEFYYYLARILVSVTFPAEYLGGGKAQTIETPDAEAVYRLMVTPGFDQQIILWSQEQYQRQRQEWLATETKN